MFVILTMCALLLFAAIHLFAAATFGLGLLILLAFWLRRRGEFWPLVAGVALFFGGVGALGIAYGAYFGAAQFWPNTTWPFIAWILGYVLGGIGGALVAAAVVILRRRTEWRRIQSELKTRFNSTKNEVKRSGFRHTLKLGAYTLRLTFFRRGASI